MSLATAVMIEASSVSSIAGREGHEAADPSPALSGGRAQVGDEVHRVGRRAAVAEGEHPAAAIEPLAHRQRRVDSAGAPSPSVRALSSPTSRALIATEPATSASTASRSCSDSERNG